MKATGPKKGVVLYDGQCPLCQRSVALLRRLDWLGRLDIRDARDPANWPDSAVPLEMDKLLAEMHVVTPDRQRAYAGFYSFRWIAARLPLLWLAWPFLFIPGVPTVGRVVYRWVAKNRFGLVPCDSGQCAVVPRPAKTSS